MATRALYNANCSICHRPPESSLMGCHHEIAAMKSYAKEAIRCFRHTPLWPKVQRLEPQITQIAICRMIDIYNTYVRRREAIYYAAMTQAQAMPLYATFMAAGMRPHPDAVPRHFADALSVQINGAKSTFNRKCNKDWVKVNAMIPQLLAEAWAAVDLVPQPDVYQARASGRPLEGLSRSPSTRRGSLDHRMRRMSLG
ncbi:Hypothetical protein D9617_4g001260 [Elsinoe fawcettii]|nr:Hypothetical protein D9617_4g001260 [Elsinoe fawcettii]